MTNDPKWAVPNALIWKPCDPVRQWREDAMREPRSAFVLATAAILVTGVPLFAQNVGALAKHRVALDTVEYSGTRAVRVTEDGQVPNGEAYAIVQGPPFHNGSIEVD